MVWGVKKSVTGFAALMAIALVGCESKVAQCNKLIEVVNQGQQISQNIQGTDAATMDKLAADLGGLSEEIKGVEINDETLIGFRDRFKEWATPEQDVTKPGSTFRFQVLV